MGNAFEHGFVEPLEEGHPTLETLREIQFAAHGLLGNRRHLFAHTGGLGQFIDYFGFDKGGIHIETHQTAIAAIGIVGLEGNIRPQLARHIQKLRPHPGQIPRCTAHGQFHAGFLV